MKEVWKEVPNYNGIYAISNLGRLKSLDHTVIRSDGKPYHIKEKIIDPRITNGYKQATLTYLNQKYHIGLHRLVALAFIPNPQNKPCVNHIDGNKLNNNVCNLEWVTESENVHHAFNTGLRKTCYGNRKLTDADIKFIKDAYKNRTSRFWGKKKIAENLGISMSTIDLIIQGKIWENVNSII